MRACGPAGLAICALLGARPAAAEVHRVDSLAALQSTIDAAAPGDLVEVRDGVYTASAPVAVKRAGASGRPIRIAAQHVGGVTIAGSNGFDVVAPAAYVEIDGFVFTHASGTTQVHSGASHVRFTHNVFECTGAGAYLTIAANDTEIDRNEFRNKRTLGNMIDVRGEGSQVAQRVHIHDNYFHDFASPGPGTNGAETIRFGLSGLSMSKGFGIIERNLFLRCVGENEMLSIKSGGNFIRDNTLLDSPGAQLTLRHGNENVVTGNYLRGTDGIRIFGDRNRVGNNYLADNTTAIQIGNGDGEVADGAPLTSHDRPDGNEISLNTLVGNARNFFMARREKGLGATHTIFTNNIIEGGGPAAVIEGPYSDAVWRANVLWQTAGPGAMPSGSYEEREPALFTPFSLSVEQMLKLIRER